MLDMTAEEIGAFLDERETGVLSLAKGSEARGFVESFGYRNGRLYFLLATPDDEQKREFLARTETVCLTVYEANGPQNFAGVTVRGTMVELADDRTEADLALGANDQFPSEGVFPPGDGKTAVEYELRIEEISGVKGGAFDIDTSAPNLPAVSSE